MDDNDFAAWNAELKNDGKGPTPLDDPKSLSDATADAMFSTMMETAYQLANEYENPQLAMTIIARSMRYAAELVENMSATLCAPVSEEEANTLGYRNADEFYNDYQSALALRGAFAHITQDKCDGVHEVELNDGSILKVTMTDGETEAYVRPWWTMEDE